MRQLLYVLVYKIIESSPILFCIVIKINFKNSFIWCILVRLKVNFRLGINYKMKTKHKRINSRPKSTLRNNLKILLDV